MRGRGRYHAPAAAHGPQEHPPPRHDERTSSHCAPRNPERAGPRGARGPSGLVGAGRLASAAGAAVPAGRRARVAGVSGLSVPRCGGAGEPGARLSGLGPGAHARGAPPVLPGLRRYAGRGDQVRDAVRGADPPPGADREPRGAARAPRRRRLGAARGGPPVQLGMDAARAVARARLSARCGLQAAGGPLGRTGDEEGPQPLRLPPDPGQAAARGHPQARRGHARGGHGGRPGADHERTQALDALSEPRHRVLHGSGGDLARHALPGVLHRHAARAPRLLRNALRPAERRRGSGSRPGSSPSATCRPSRRRSAPPRPTGRGRTSAGS